jgi:hypothetical protein
MGGRVGDVLEAAAYGDTMGLAEFSEGLHITIAAFATPDYLRLQRCSRGLCQALAGPAVRRALGVNELLRFLAKADRTTPPDQLLRTACMQGDLVAIRWIMDHFAITADAACRFDLLCHLCGGGYLSAAQWFADRMAIATDAMQSIPRIFEGACFGGHMPVAQWLVFRFKLTPTDAALQWACDGGHLAVAQWLATRFGLHADPGAALWGACIGGHLDVARWIAENHDITPEFVRVGRNALFGRVCRNGHLSAAVWLADHFSLTIVDVRECRALNRACYEHELPVAQWLGERYALTAEDFRETFLFGMLCSDGASSIVQWATERFGLTAEDARARQNYAVRAACSSGYIGLARWLVDRFKLSDTDLRDCDFSALLAASARGHLLVLQWLAERDGLMSETDYRNGFFEACENGRLPEARFLAGRCRLTAADLSAAMRIATRNIIAWLEGPTIAQIVSAFEGRPA